MPNFGKGVVGNGDKFSNISERFSRMMVSDHRDFFQGLHKTLQP